MPEDDVSDLRDVVDAINKLCDTMKTSRYDDAETFEETDEVIVCEEEVNVVPQYVDSIVSDPVEQVSYIYQAEEPPVAPLYTECYPELISPEEICVQTVETYTEPASPELVQKVETYSELVSPEETSAHRVEAYRAERWSDSQISLPGQTEDVETITSDTEPAAAQFEPISEMYYTASSEVSLLSDLDLPEKVHVDEDSLPEKESKDDRKECVIAGHVAAMRERFESMTRANTPCPDLARSTSPSLDVFRNVTPSPDHLA